jgi:hypothetical protein
VIKIENTEVFGWEAAIRGMRNPMNSWDRSDTAFYSYDEVYIGENDLKLMRSLGKAGAVHGKYLRMINVTCDITCNHVWWAEFDTYKIATVRNSCSKMHKIHVKEFVKDDFSHEGIDECGGRTTEVFDVVLIELERLRKLFNETHEKKYWRAIIELLPMGYNIKATVQLNYEVLRGMYEYRKNHKMFEWVEFCKWIETLPYFKEILLDDNRS